jgi:DNA-binding transcriptional LysR family regulator
MAPLIAEFQLRYPELNLELILADRMVDMVEEGFDVTVRISRPEDSSLVARKIAPCNFVIAASPEYIEQYGYPANAAELAQHRCLHYTYGPGRNSWPLWSDGKEQMVRINPTLESNNGDVLCAAAVEGMGIVLSPTFIVCDALRSGKLVPLLQQYGLKPVAIYAVFPSSRLVSAKVRLWVDFLVEKLGDNPHWDRVPNRR